MMDDISRWKNRVALVTGASSGIGRAIAGELARGGMWVAVCARRTERLEQLQQELGDVILPIPTDLRDEGQITAMFEKIRERWGGVDVLVNNAAMGRATSLIDGKAEDWREMWELNVLALSLCTREALQDMRRRGDDGYVIHISSMSGHRQGPSSNQNSMYTATKYAVRALTEALRRELREKESGIRVTAISPGVVETEFAAHFHRDEEAIKRAYSRFPPLQPEDIAAVVRFILSRPPHVQPHDIMIRPTEQQT